MKKTSHPQIDEREEQNNYKALAAGGGFALVFTLFKFVYLGFVEKVPFTELGWDLFLLVAFGLVVTISLWKNQSYDIPKSFLGKPLPTEKDRAAKKERALKNYLPDSLMFSLAFTGISYVMGDVSTVTQVATEFSLYLIISFIINYTWHEYSVKKHNEDVED